jgi:hypothetical protein
MPEGRVFMSRSRKAIGALAAALAIGVLAAPAVQADSIKDCVEEGTPKPNWSTEGTQKGSCNSSHPREDETVLNPGGKPPKGQQP